MLFSVRFLIPQLKFTNTFPTVGSARTISPGYHTLAVYENTVLWIFSIFACHNWWYFLVILPRHGVPFSFFFLVDSPMELTPLFFLEGVNCMWRVEGDFSLVPRILCPSVPAVNSDKSPCLFSRGPLLRV